MKCNSGTLAYYDVDRGFGLIITDRGWPLVLFAEDIVDGIPLKKDLPVEFAPVEDEKDLRARNVCIL